MIIQGIIFDINGTLIDIQTDEGNEEIYRAISHFLTYQGIYMHRREVRDAYFRIMDSQRKDSGEEHPEFDALLVWREFINQYTVYGALEPGKFTYLPRFLAEIFRGISRYRLQLYPEVKAVLDELRPRFKLAAVSDAQSVWAIPEMKAVGIDSYFNPVIISSDFGFRKPDARLFEAALAEMGLEPEEVIFVGNDMYRDIFGSRQLGMKTVFFSSNQGRR
jgi:putative hydrolase of the HAD superfamily